MFTPHVILHPTDYSESARYALGVAVDLARHHGARLIVLHVADTLGPETGLTFGEAEGELQPAGHLRHLQEELHRVKPRDGADLAIDYRLADGDPGTTIARIAREEHCDLIVLGTHGRSALSHLLSGSVTQKVLRLATCAVLTVRMPIVAG
jgi:nucleotide-binding universal stress UspA family protein